MGAHWIVQEGYLQIKADGHESGGHGVLHRAALVERYVVLYMNRKMEMFETSTKDPAHRVDACYLRAFCGWDGEGLLKAGESYGLELKLEKHANTRMFVAAFNRLDLEKWCRGFVAVLDPESAAGQEVRRERRKARKEEKRALEEREEKIRQWKEQQRKMREEEILRLQMREEEIQNMTPLERIDGLGSLDDDTARMLEKRRQRLQRRQAPTTRRVNKAAYRQRLDDAAGGKLENVQPLQAKPVQEPRIKVRVEAPAPGQYIEASGSASSRRNSNSARRRRLDSTDGSGSDSDFSRDSRMSSGPFSGGSGSFSGSIPPPPPPRSEFDDSRSDFIPPPPPSIPGSRRRDSRSQSLRGSLYDDTDRHSLSRSSISQSARYLTGVGNDKENVQASLAAILGGRKTQPRGGELRGRFDSFESTADSTANGEVAAPRTRRATGANGETPMTNAFAASLAAIRRNRADTMEDTNSVDMPSSRRRDRKRDSQLSAEGKAILQKAISMDEPSTPARKKQDTANGGRKGLFDDSSSDEDSDAGLFGIRKSNAAKSREPAAEANERLPTKGGRRGGQAPFAESEGSDDDDHHHDLGSFKRQSTPSDYTSPRSMASPASVSHVNFYSQPKNVDVIYQSGVLQNQGKKAVVVYTFAFRSGSAEQSFSRSYHEFEDIHQRLSSEALPRLPKFPSKHLLRNFTKPENMQKRAMEFVQYLQALVAIPGIFQNKRFVFEFDIHDDFVGCVLGGGSHIASSSQRTPTSTRSSKPPRGANIVSTNGAGKSRATALFGADDTDSDAESVSVPLPTPKKTKQSTTTQPAPEAEPMRKKKSKPSRKDFDDEELEPVSVTSAKRDRTRSRNSVKSVADAIPAEPTAPKIAGLPARPNLFGGGRGDLLAAIRQGAALKKTGGDGDGTVPALAAAGRGAGFPAPSSAPPPPPPPPRPAPVTNAGSVAEAISNAMASRRIHIEYEDNSDDSDDDWD